MAATKPCKIREETYDFVVEGMKAIGINPIGRCSDGLVYANHLDGEQVVIKVIKKKNQIPQEEILPITTYAQKIEKYNTRKV